MGFTRTRTTPTRPILIQNKHSKITGRGHPRAAGADARAGGGHGRNGPPYGGAGAGTRDLVSCSNHSIFDVLIILLRLLCVASFDRPVPTKQTIRPRQQPKGWYDAWRDWLLGVVYGPLLLSSMPPHDPPLLAAAVRCLATEGLCGDPRAQEVG